MEPVLPSPLPPRNSSPSAELCDLEDASESDNVILAALDGDASGPSGDNLSSNEQIPSRLGSGAIPNMQRRVSRSRTISIAVDEPYRPDLEPSHPSKPPSPSGGSEAEENDEKNLDRTESHGIGMFDSGAVRSVDTEAAKKTFSHQSGPKRVFSSLRLVHELEDEVLVDKVGSCGIRIMDPRGAFRMRWDVIVLIALLFNLVEIPIRLCFEVDAEAWSAADLFNLFVDLFFICDIVVNINSGFYKDGFLINEPQVVRKQYLRTWFTLDLLTSIPYSHIINIFVASASSSSSSPLRASALIRLIRLIRLVKLLRLIKLAKALSAWNNSYGTLSSIIKTNKFLILVFFIAHISGCLWMLIAMSEVNSDGSFHQLSWIYRFYDGDVLFPEDKTLGEKYLLCLYWAITTITTVGYGDITPMTHGEISFAVCLEIIGACVFGYVIGNVSSIMSSTKEAEKLMETKIRAINEYMR